MLYIPRWRKCSPGDVGGRTPPSTFAPGSAQRACPVKWGADKLVYWLRDVVRLPLGLWIVRIPIKFIEKWRVSPFSCEDVGDVINRFQTFFVQFLRVFVSLFQCVLSRDFPGILHALLCCRDYEIRIVDGYSTQISTIHLHKKRPVSLKSTDFLLQNISFESKPLSCYPYWPMHASTNTSLPLTLKCVWF